MRWPSSLSKKIKSGVALKPLTSFKIGGAARYFFEPDNIFSLQQALCYARKKSLPVFILGAGSNLLVADQGVNGLVIKLSHPVFKQIYHQGSCIIAGSGLKLSQLVLYAARHSLGGVEFLAGIPGCLGGSLLGNAGAWGHSIGRLAQQVGILDYNGRFKVLSARELKFGYRKSNLAKFVIIWVKLKLCSRDKNKIASRIKQYLSARGSSQDSRLPNAGCVFKNPAGSSAGKLLDRCGLKGLQVGKAAVSLKHANFILNTGGASFREVSGLMALMRKKVKKAYKVDLKPEIKIWK